MAIVIDGSSAAGTVNLGTNGTISNLAVGGLPNGIVDTDMLAANAVTAAKASGGRSLLGADQWRISSSFTMSTSGADITDNRERVDTDGFDKLGSGMSESSGIFTFPDTGIWYIEFVFSALADTGDSKWNELVLHTTLDNSSYDDAAYAYCGNFFNSEDYRSSGNGNFIFKVSNTSTHKCKFRQYAYGSDVEFRGNGTINLNAFTFLKLGDI